MNTGKSLGIVLIVLGTVAVLIAAMWTLSAYVSRDLTIAALVLGVGLALLIFGPVVAAGAYMVHRGRVEAAWYVEAQKERQLLGMVQAHGQVEISDVALELNATRDQVKEWVYDLVDKGLFAGYTDWTKGTLYSRDAARLRGNRCPNCGGEVVLAGKGTIKCPFCGAEIFLTD